jgi:minor extracellular serine protease Vpr
MARICRKLWRLATPARSVLSTLLLLGVFGGELVAQVIPGQYVVRLHTEPILALSEFRSGSQRVALLRQLESDGEEGELRSRASALRLEQSALRSRLRGLGPAVVVGRTELTMNALIVNIADSEVDQLRRMPEVAEIYPSVMYHKTLDAALPLIHAQEAWNARTGGEAGAGSGVKIGVIDTGLDISHPMLQDPTLTPPAGFPKYTQSSDAACISDDHKFTNSKVIVARNYVRLLPTRELNCDAMDRDGHGTFSSTVAAGRRVAAPLASIAGVAPHAFLGNYKVFGTPGSNDSASLSAVMAALDDAVRDGMDVINLSLGADLGLPPASDPLALAVKAAVQAGVVVVAAAGNEGPGSGTISSPGIAPEAITVGASTNSRKLALPLEISATVSVPANLQRLPATVGAGVSITIPIGPVSIADAQRLTGDGTACAAIAPGAMAGRIVLIERGVCSFQTKIANAQAGGAMAVILFNKLHSRDGNADTFAYDWK